MAKKNTTQKSFEKCLQELEKIQENLSEGDLQLDKAIAEYEKGIQLLKTCYQVLEKAEKKISILTENSKGEWKEQPFGEDDADMDEEAEGEEEGELF